MKNFSLLGLLLFQADSTNAMLGENQEETQQQEQQDFIDKKRPEKLTRPDKETDGDKLTSLECQTKNTKSQRQKDEEEARRQEKEERYSDRASREFFKKTQRSGREGEEIYIFIEKNMDSLQDYPKYDSNDIKETPWMLSEIPNGSLPSDTYDAYNEEDISLLKDLFIHKLQIVLKLHHICRKEETTESTKSQGEKLLEGLGKVTEINLGQDFFENILFWAEKLETSYDEKKEEYKKEEYKKEEERLRKFSEKKQNILESFKFEKRAMACDSRFSSEPPDDQTLFLRIFEDQEQRLVNTTENDDVDRVEEDHFRFVKSLKIQMNEKHRIIKNNALQVKDNKLHKAKKHNEFQKKHR